MEVTAIVTIGKIKDLKLKRILYLPKDLGAMIFFHQFWTTGGTVRTCPFTFRTTM
jgi:hypothetical protein